MKKMTWMLLFLGLLWTSSGWAEELQSTNYLLRQAAVDSGGESISTGSFKLLFQSFAPTVQGISEAEEKQTIHGLYYSSEIYSMEGVNTPYDRGLIPLAPKDNGLITTKVEIKGEINGVTANLGLSSRGSDGWVLDWNSREQVPKVSTAKLLARAFDGLTWGPWKITETFTVDNEAPLITSFNLTALGLALNSREGLLQGFWLGEDSQSEVKFDVEIRSNAVNPKLLPGLRLWLDASNSDSIETDNNQQMQRWIDYSGFDNHIVQDDETLRPKLAENADSQSYLNFEDYDQVNVTLDELKASSNFTIIVVSQPGFDQKSSLHFGIESSASKWIAGVKRNNTVGFDYGNKYFEMPRLHTGWTIETVLHDGQTGTWNYFINGLSTIDALGVSSPENDQLLGKLSIGKVEKTPGVNRIYSDLGEVLVFNRQLSQQERRDLESSLAIKWGLANQGPDQLPGLAFWFDSTDTSTIEVDEKGRVKRWMDKSVFLHTATQHSDDLKPQWQKNGLNNRPALQFKGNQVLTMISGLNKDPFSFSIVYQPSTNVLASDREQLVGMSAAGGNFKTHFTNDDRSSLKIYKGSNGRKSDKNVSVDQQAANIITVINTSENMTIFVNGEEQVREKNFRGTVQWKNLNIGASTSKGENGFHGSIGEVIVFDRGLTQEERKELDSYLITKWKGVYFPDWSLGSQDVTGSAWVSSTLGDNTRYLLRLSAKDQAGNKLSKISRPVRTPDRTAPMIGKVDAGVLVETLDEIVSTEDVKFSFNLSEYEWDASSVDEDLRWDNEIYTNVNADKSLEDPYKAAENIFKSIVFRNQNGHFFDFIPSPNANTGLGIDAGIEPGNRYGKNAAYMRVELIDKEGNSATQSVRLHVQAVNDAPYFTDWVGGGQIYRDSKGKIIYNVIFDEDTTFSGIQLDDYIDDVDDLIGNLTVTVGGPNFYQVGAVPFSADVHSFFESYFLKAKVSDASTGHTLELTPTASWYGNQTVFIRVSDDDLVPTFAEQQFIARVWPVNDAPIIDSGIPVYMEVDEDFNLTLALQAYESDSYLEDLPPTYNNNLDWNVSTYDSEVIVSINGQKGSADRIGLTPSSNWYGTTEIELTLTDTDEIPLQIFDKAEPTRYEPNPMSSTVTAAIVWLPINDAPIIITPDAQVVTEDSKTWTLDLSSLGMDIEDTVSKLSWAVSVSENSLVSHSFDGNKLTFTPSVNAFGTGKFILSLTDTDEDIDFSPYTPNPKTTHMQVEYIIEAVNDIPYLGSISVSGNLGVNPARVMSTDSLTVTAIDFFDVGVSADVVVSVNGNEYTAATDTSTQFVQNQILYNYRWSFLDSEGVTQSATETLEQSSSQNNYSITNAVEGQSLFLEVWPSDGIDDGIAVTLGISVNARPSIVDASTATPTGDYWTGTPDVKVTWQAATDPDEGDTIGYRYLAWTVPHWYSDPPDVSTATPVVDSNWQEGNFLEYEKTYDDGHYYWTVYSGNKFTGDNWDYRTSNWLNKFHVDTVPPVVSTSDAILYTQSIIDNPGVKIADALNTRVLYGERINAGEDFLYSIWIEEENTQDGVTVIQSYEIVPTTDATAWTHRITYPAGETKYTIKIVDNVKDANGNPIPDHSTDYLSFTITQDVIPPDPPDISGTPGISFVNNTWIAIASANYFNVTGNKEAYSSVWYEGVELVGFTSQDFFSALVFTDKPTGNLTARDRSGNESTPVAMAITFVVGSPEISTFNQSRTVINSADNAGISNLSAVLRDSISKTTLTWAPSRNVSAYSYDTSTGKVLGGGGSVSAGTLTADTIFGNNSGLDEGVNTVNLTIVDTAGNIGIQTFNIKRLTEAPTTNAISSGTIQFSGGFWIVDIIGTLDADVTPIISIDGVEQVISTFNNGTWRYFNREFDLENDDILLTFRDSVYNEASRLIWDHTDYETSKTEFTVSSVGDSILLPYTSLPKNLIRLYAKQMTKNGVTTKTGLSLSTYRAAVDNKPKDKTFSISEQLKQSVYQLYAKAFDTSIKTNVDLSGHDIKMAIPIPEDPRIELDTVVAVHFNEEDNEWQLMDVKGELLDDERKFVLPVDKAGIYGLAQMQVAVQDYSAYRVYPNPWIPEDGDDNTGTLATGIVFDRLPVNTTVRLYTITGQLMLEKALGSETSWNWDGLNAAGRRAASGVYVYVLNNGSNTVKGKFTVIR